MNRLKIFLRVCEFVDFFFIENYISYYEFGRYFRCIVRKTQWIPFDNKFFIRSIKSKIDNTISRCDIESTLILSAGFENKLNK